MSELSCCIRLWVAVDEVKDKELDVFNGLMGWQAEVFAHVSVHSGMGDLGKVFANPGHQFAFSLSHILQPTSGAWDSINQVGPFAGNVGRGSVGTAYGVGCNPT